MSVENDTGESKEMPQYVSHKKVRALEISAIGPFQIKNGQGCYQVAFCDLGFAPIELPKVMFSRYMPIPGDFYVVYGDEYRSFSPRKAFLEGYTRES